MTISSILVFITSFYFSLILTFCPINPASASIFHFEGTPPNNLGVNGGNLSSCPSSPNCVVSKETDETHYIKPISYNSDRESAKSMLIKVLSVVPNTLIVQEEDRSRSRINRAKG